MTTVVMRPAPRNQLERYVDQYPIGMVAAAMGAGYLLSGALFSKATVRMLGFGLRFGLRYATPAVIHAALAGLESDDGTPPNRERSATPTRTRKENHENID
jgi:hypothetical protein